MTQKEKYVDCKFNSGVTLRPLWDHKKCLPIIREEIYHLCTKSEDWVHLKEIVEVLLQNETISDESNRVHKIKGEKKKNVIANMVAFLNQRVTQFEDGSVPISWHDFAEKVHSMFERRKIGGRYAFRLRNPADEQDRGSVSESQKVSERKKKQNAFAKYVKELDEKLRKGEISLEDSRSLRMKFWEK